MKKILCLVALFVTINPAFARSGAKNELMIAAAVSMKDALTAVSHNFKKTHPDINLAFNYGASGQIRIQIENGAPVDVFISASSSDMDSLERKGLIDSSTRRDIAKNSLVLVSKKGSGLKKISELLDDKIARIVIGNPITVPAGAYAKEVLEKQNLSEKVAKKLILAENVRQALDYVARGEVDAGFVYKTDALTENSLEIVWNATPNQHRSITYPCAIIKDSEHRETALEFTKYLQSSEAKSEFRKYGFQ